MGFIRDFDNKHKDSAVWQFIKFNLVSTSITLLQLLLANLLPLLFDNMLDPLPSFLQKIFVAERLFPEGSRYVVDGAVTWGYVLPFFLSNFIANIYGYFMNMRTTFRGKGTKAGFAFYVVLMIVLILFSTWLQGAITAALAGTSFEGVSRTLAALAAGMVQMVILFPLEKFVLFKE